MLLEYAVDLFILFYFFFIYYIMYFTQILDFEVIIGMIVYFYYLIEFLNFVHSLFINFLEISVFFLYMNNSEILFLLHAIRA